MTVAEWHKFCKFPAVFATGVCIMEQDTLPASSAPEPVSGNDAFYRDVMQTLHREAIPFLVGGTYAYNRHTGINRPTRDLDIFIRRADFGRAAAALSNAGNEVDLTFPHWLGKARRGDAYIDIIFSSGNAVAEVDDLWFEHAACTEVLGIPVKISPVEEMIWSKAFIMERERYDGADVAQLLRACGHRLDWARLFRRFDAHWRVLLSHLVLFGFVYPEHRRLVPDAVMEELLERLRREQAAEEVPCAGVCHGTLLSREQYLADVEQQGLRDARVEPLGKMSAEDTAHWTRAIRDDHEPQ
jgi:hypothetical protein